MPHSASCRKHEQCTLGHRGTSSSSEEGTLGESRPLRQCQRWQRSKPARGTKNPPCFSRGSVTIVLFFLKERGFHMSQTEHQLSLSLFYKGWDVYQQRLVAAIAPLTAEQLALLTCTEKGKGLSASIRQVEALTHKSPFWRLIQSTHKKTDYGRRS